MADFGLQREIVDEKKDHQVELDEIYRWEMDTEGPPWCRDRTKTEKEREGADERVGERVVFLGGG